MEVLVVSKVESFGDGFTYLNNDLKTTIMVAFHEDGLINWPVSEM